MSNLKQRIYTFYGAIADTTVSKDFDLHHTNAYASVTFFDADPRTNAAAAIVLPTAGKLTLTASEDGSNFGTITNGAIDVTIATYTRPNWAGHTKNVKATPAAISGGSATHYRVTVVRS